MIIYSTLKIIIVPIIVCIVFFNVMYYWILWSLLYYYVPLIIMSVLMYYVYSKLMLCIFTLDMSTISPCTIELWCDYDNIMYIYIMFLLFVLLYMKQCSRWFLLYKLRFVTYVFVSLNICISYPYVYASREIMFSYAKTRFYHDFLFCTFSSIEIVLFWLCAFLLA